MPFTLKLHQFIKHVEESVTRFGLHNDMIFIFDVIKENKLFL